MAAYYNEIDPFAAQWLRNLIADGQIAPGDVDERSIVEVKADDLRGYTQCHFFAGIGGWSLALRMAGVPDDFRCWTGSCPCQPFSDAGERRAESDERHLWPQLYRLIGDGKPPVALGEQVASRLGRDWLAGVRTDLEALGYEVGAADLCAAGVGAPHIRQRLYWVADSQLQRTRIGVEGVEGQEGVGRDRPAIDGETGDRGLAEPRSRGREVANLHGGSSRQENGVGQADIAGVCGASFGLGDTDEPGSQGRIERWDGPCERAAGSAGLGHWDAFDLIPCRDGKSRRVEPGTFPLAHGVSNRVGLLRGYGNAIVPQVAARFIQAAVECLTPRVGQKGRSDGRPGDAQDDQVQVLQG